MTYCDARGIILSRNLTVRAGGDYMDIKKTRENKRLTQEELAEAIGVSRTAVAMWETKHILPRASRLTKLADILGVTVDELLTERE